MNISKDLPILKSQTQNIDLWVIGMDNKVCFLFGQSTAPAEVADLVQEAAECHYLEHRIRTFVIGSRGNFDSYGATAIKRLKKKYTDITL